MISFAIFDFAQTYDQSRSKKYLKQTNIHSWHSLSHLNLAYEHTTVFWNDKGGPSVPRSCFDLNSRELICVGIAWLPPPCSSSRTRMAQLCTVSYFGAHVLTCTHVRSRRFSSIAQWQPQSDHADCHILHYQLVALYLECIYKCVIKFFERGSPCLRWSGFARPSDIQGQPPRLYLCDSWASRSQFGVIVMGRLILLLLLPNNSYYDFDISFWAGDSPVDDSQPMQFLPFCICGEVWCLLEFPAHE